MAEQPSTAEPYVFLSYASGDRERVLTLADSLESSGIRVWLDRRSLIGGVSWDAAIVRAVKNCTVFAVLCTPASVTSPNVMQELRLAWEEQRPTLPVLLAAVSFPDEMRYILAGRQWVEILDRSEGEWLPALQSALRGLGAMATPAQAVAGSAAPTPVERPPIVIPTPLARFIGREQELADIVRLLSASRLLTLTGPGGSGKTRLALAVAQEVRSTFPDGVVFVDLAPLLDPLLVPTAVAKVLGVPERSNLSVGEGIGRFLHEKQLLLVLDNYEHLLAAAAFVVALLQEAPHLVVLVTSRAPLRVPGEQEYDVLPLPVPTSAQSSVAALIENPAVDLFVTRAHEVRPDFRLTAQNAGAVADICRRLDGLPLALELAAARIRVLPVDTLLARLEHRLPVLTGGARTAPARQQTLRATIGWSYDLLAPTEQQLLRRLGVFAGGCTLDLAEAVCNADRDLGLDMLDGVSSLLEKSLLREVAGYGDEPRYRMLETIREFALGELEASAEAEDVRRQLAVQLLQLARRYAATNGWQRLDAEVDNARAVLSWCVARAELAVGARLLWALRDYLFNHGHSKELVAWRNRLLALPEATQPTISRARLLVEPGVDLGSSAERARATADVEESVALSRELGDAACLALGLNWLALRCMHQGSFAAAVPLAEEALPLYLAQGSMQAVLMQNLLAIVAIERGDLATAGNLVAANRALEGANRTFYGLTLEAGWAEARGDETQARTFLEEGVRKSAALLGRKAPARLQQLAHLARITFRLGDLPAAVATCAESLTVQQSIGPTVFLAPAVNVLAMAAERCDLLDASARLLAAVEVLRRQFATDGLGLPAAQQAAIARLRPALEPDDFAVAWAAGEALSADGAIEYGLVVVAELEARLRVRTTAAGTET